MTAFALTLMGAAGLVRDPSFAPFEADFQETWIKSPVNRIAGGADEIQRNIIAERALGLKPDFKRKRT